MNDTSALRLIVFVGSAARPDAVESIVPPDDLQWLRDAAALVFTALSPAGLPDRVRERLAEGESVLVVGFEQWSGAGPAIDARWLHWHRD